MKNKQAKKDKQVEKMLKNWDKVKCHKCGKKISMLNAILDSEGQYFFCKNGCR